MKLISQEKYITTILEVEYQGEEYKIVHSDDYDDVFTPEWHIVDIDNNIIEDTELLNKLKDFGRNNI